MIEITKKSPLPPQGSSNRSFGFVFTTVFALIGLYPLLHNEPVRIWSLGTSGAILLISLVYPDLLAIPNRIWGFIGLVLHKITNPVIMGVIFYLVITPIAMLMRIFSTIPLKLKFDSKLDSYWIERDKNQIQEYRNQF